MWYWPFDQPDQGGPKTRAWRLVQGIAFVALINFVLFVAASSYFGGDALNGYRQGGHYFLGMHGRFTEVSRSIFLYSESHALILIGMFAFVMGSALLFRLKILD